MPKDIPQETNPPSGNDREQRGRQQEPLSGSKKVKNKVSHSGQRYGEGS